MAITGAELVVRTLSRHGVDAFFYIMGAPMMGVEKGAIEAGIRGVDVRHEQAAAMMAHAYARVRRRIGVCMGCSGPGTVNIASGLATALGGHGGSPPTYEHSTSNDPSLA
jgi:thiamine pyrophosphate-dependent acetolactate synthase large subunit-like protein